MPTKRFTRPPPIDTKPSSKWSTTEKKDQSLSTNPTTEQTSTEKKRRLVRNRVISTPTSAETLQFPSSEATNEQSDTIPTIQAIDTTNTEPTTPITPSEQKATRKRKFHNKEPSKQVETPTESTVEPTTPQNEEKKVIISPEVKEPPKSEKEETKSTIPTAITKIDTPTIDNTQSSTPIQAPKSTRRISKKPKEVKKVTTPTEPKPNLKPENNTDSDKKPELIKRILERHEKEKLEQQNVEKVVLKSETKDEEEMTKVVSIEFDDEMSDEEVKPTRNLRRNLEKQVNKLVPEPIKKEPKKPIIISISEEKAKTPPHEEKKRKISETTITVKEKFHEIEKKETKIVTVDDISKNVEPESKKPKLTETISTAESVTVVPNETSKKQPEPALETQREIQKLDPSQKPKEEASSTKPSSTVITTKEKGQSSSSSTGTDISKIPKKKIEPSQQTTQPNNPNPPQNQRPENSHQQSSHNNHSHQSDHYHNNRDHRDHRDYRHDNDSYSRYRYRDPEQDRLNREASLKLPRLKIEYEDTFFEAAKDLISEQYGSNKPKNTSINTVMPHPTLPPKEQLIYAIVYAKVALVSKLKEEEKRTISQKLVQKIAPQESLETLKHESSKGKIENYVDKYLREKKLIQ